MEPKVWYTVELQLVENQRGYINLLFRDNWYGEVRRKEQKSCSQTTTWRCSRRSRGCMARVTTCGRNQLKMGIHEHNHPPVVLKANRNKPYVPLPEFCNVQPKSIEVEDVVKVESCD